MPGPKVALFWVMVVEPASVVTPDPLLARPPPAYARLPATTESTNARVPWLPIPPAPLPWAKENWFVQVKLPLVPIAAPSVSEMPRTGIDTGPANWAAWGKAPAPGRLIITAATYPAAAALAPLTEKKHVPRLIRATSLGSVAWAIGLQAVPPT